MPVYVIFSNCHDNKLWREMVVMYKDICIFFFLENPFWSDKKSATIILQNARFRRSATDGG